MMDDMVSDVRGFDSEKRDEQAIVNSSLTGKDFTGEEMEEYRVGGLKKTRPTSVVTNIGRRICMGSTTVRSEKNQPFPCISRLRSSRSGSGLLAQDWLAHDGILASHPSSQCALHLGPESQLVQVVALLCSRDKALGLQGLVIQALQAIAEVSDVGDSRVSAG
jgi:hypothetical protein